MNIEEFTQGYKAASERKDKYMFAALFVADGEYHNTPLAFQGGQEQLHCSEGTSEGVAVYSRNFRSP